ncbi:MAG: hypothetical protein ACFFAS_18590 [Promethearchaeota archaeon]
MIEKAKTEIEQLNLANAPPEERFQKEQTLVMLTPGDPAANDLLVENIIERLQWEIEFKWKKKSFFQSLEKNVNMAGLKAISKNSQNDKRVLTGTMEGALRGVSVIPEPNLAILPKKSKRKNRVAKD